jgi:hypothetical protein
VLGDGFIVVHGPVDAFELVSRLHQFLEEVGRSEKAFGLHCNMLQAKTQVAEAVEVGGSVDQSERESSVSIERI